LRGKANHAPAGKFNDQDFSNSMVCFSSAIDTHKSCRGAPAGIHWRDACTEDEKCTRAAIMGDLVDREAEQLFPCEAEQQK